MKRFIQQKAAFTLAEVFSPHFKGQRKIAFTLAEVLITLGIIGVVAAITMPTLIQNYKKTVYVNQLKKSISIWEQGFQLMLADDGVEKISDTEFYKSLNGNEYASYVDMSAANNILTKYFKIINFLQGAENVAIGDNSRYPYKCLDSGNESECSSWGSDEAIFNLADGSTVSLFVSNPPNNSYPIGEVVIDVNGQQRGPNQWGRDAFAFDLLDNGHLKPVNTIEEIQEDSSFCGDYNSNDLTGSTGYGCAARIMADGWKMNY